MKYFQLIFLLFSLSACQDGDDASFLNNTNETVFVVNIPMSYVFDRQNTPVVVEFFDNNKFKGQAMKIENLFMLERDENDKVKPVEEYHMTYLNLLKQGNYYARCFIDLNKNGRQDRNEPISYFYSKDNPKKIRVLKESRRTISFDFEV
jgi:hypothetical protein